MRDDDLSVEPEGYYVSQEFLKISTAWRWAFLSRSPIYKAWYKRYTALAKKYQEETTAQQRREWNDTARVVLGCQDEFLKPSKRRLDPELSRISKGPQDNPVQEAFIEMYLEVRGRFGLKKARAPKPCCPERPLSDPRRFYMLPDAAYVIWPAVARGRLLFYHGFEPSSVSRINRSPSKYPRLMATKRIVGSVPFKTPGKSPINLLVEGSTSLLAIDLRAKEKDVLDQVKRLYNDLAELSGHHDKDHRSRDKKYCGYLAVWDMRRRGLKYPLISARLPLLVPGLRASPDDARGWYRETHRIITGHKYDRVSDKGEVHTDVDEKLIEHLRGCEECRQKAAAGEYKYCVDGEAMARLAYGHRSGRGRINKVRDQRDPRKAEDRKSEDGEAEDAVE